MKKILPLIEIILCSMLVCYSVATGSIEWTILAFLILCQIYKEEIK